MRSGATSASAHEATLRRRLVEDPDAPRKQRHAALPIWQQLLEEEGVVVAESSACNLVGVLWVEINGTARR